MPTITIKLDDWLTIAGLYGELADRYGLDSLSLHDGIIGRAKLGDLPSFQSATSPTAEPEPEADPTPPHGTPRPNPTKPRRKRPLVTSVPCDYCQAPAGSRCVSANGNRWDAYDYGHATRIRDRDRAWKATQTS